MDQACIFCRIVAGAAPASFVHQDELVAAFMDTRPVNRGHTLVIPKAHAAGIADLPPETGARIFTVAMRLSAAVREATGCHGVNLHVADGEAAGQEVAHFHLHVIPRFRGDRFGVGLRGRLPSRPKREELDAVAVAIRGALGVV
ncbi:MAG: HIT family protein [Chloroflexi bacterium]|nr:HIT family protein [Chloroflexota bacterium]